VAAIARAMEGQMQPRTKTSKYSTTKKFFELAGDIDQYYEDQVLAFERMCNAYGLQGNEVLGIVNRAYESARNRGTIVAIEKEARS
jgi:hypothetical protein